MLLPGENYSERLMQTLHSYRETWVNGAPVTLIGEAISSLERAQQISLEDKKEIKALKSKVKTDNVDFQEIAEFVIDVYEFSKKATRFSRIAAPLILADGPLPFGDAVFVIALGLDVGLAAYNLVNRDD